MFKLQKAITVFFIIFLSISLLASCFSLVKAQTNLSPIPDQWYNDGSPNAFFNASNPYGGIEVLQVNSPDGNTSLTTEWDGMPIYLNNSAIQTFTFTCYIETSDAYEATDINNPTSGGRIGIDLYNASNYRITGIQNQEGTPDLVTNTSNTFVEFGHQTWQKMTMTFTMAHSYVGDGLLGIYNVPNGTVSTVDHVIPWCQLWSSYNGFNMGPGVWAQFGGIFISLTDEVSANALLATISPTSSNLEVGQQTVFTATPSGGSLTYNHFNWYVNGTQQSETSNQFIFTMPTDDNYVVTATVTDSLGTTSILSNSAIITHPTVVPSETITYTNSPVSSLFYFLALCAGLLIAGIVSYLVFPYLGLVVGIVGLIATGFFGLSGVLIVSQYVDVNTATTYTTLMPIGWFLLAPASLSIFNILIPVMKHRS